MIPDQGLTMSSKSPLSTFKMIQSEINKYFRKSHVQFFFLHMHQSQIEAISEGGHLHKGDL